MPDAMRVGVLISGRGSNLEALIRGSGQARYQVVFVASNRPDAPGLAIAAQRGIETRVVDSAGIRSRRQYDEQLAQAIDSANLDLIVLAGFMRILTADFVTRYSGRMINIHPSLLPRYRGLDTHQRALDAGDREHGASVHFVTPELDGGPVIAQSVIAVAPEDSAASLAERVLAKEHFLLPYVVGLFSEHRIQLQDSYVLYDGSPLTSPLILP